MLYPLSVAISMLIGSVPSRNDVLRLQSLAPHVFEQQKVDGSFRECVQNFNPDRCSNQYACVFLDQFTVKRLKMAGSCPVLSSGTQAVIQTEASPNFTQGRGNVGTNTVASTSLGVAGPIHSGSAARLSAATTVQVS
jgi:hypothetical protein